MFFNGWDSLFRILIVGVPAYVALVVFLRVSGKRTLSRMNAFDLVVTVALGSTLATGEALMLLYRGEFLPAAMRHARVTQDEVRAAVRSAGFHSLDHVQAVVLETDGSFSVVAPGEGGNGSSLIGVDGPRQPG